MFSLMVIVADNQISPEGKHCSRCGSSNLSFGEFDPKNGTPVKCNECGNIRVINHNDYWDTPMEALEEDED